ncbi:hypothetical protein MA16_Dca002997 [Dendrobium catenatum]|uniref:Uncharacterized protein n=1 Tax=Dendrobium catenatum TaxID=906689 RepID=A0A2I0X9B5_9ASPA|nr:hypothetical protein MA16_Dca002997 [Dendrobium catenatum]
MGWVRVDRTTRESIRIDPFRKTRYSGRVPSARQVASSRASNPRDRTAAEQRILRPAGPVRTRHLSGGGTHLCFLRVFGELFFMLCVLKLIEQIICLINSISQLSYPFVESRVLIADLCLVSGKHDSLDLRVVLSQAFQFLLHARLPSDLLF